MAGAEEQVIVRFVSEVDEYAVNDEPLELPARLTRYGLSELVNHLLRPARPVPFDFLAGGELLRTSLRKFMQLRALSGEATLELRYFPLVGEPELTSQQEQPDWISALSSRLADGLVVTGCYDGVARVFAPPAASAAAQALAANEDGHDQTGSALCELAPPAGAAASAIKAATIIGAPREGAVFVAVGALDGSLRLWRGRLRAEGGAAGVGVCAGVCVGHDGSVEAIAAAGSDESEDAWLASGSHDGAVRLWSVAAAMDAADAADATAADLAAATPVDEGGDSLGGGKAKRRKGAAVAPPPPPPPPPPPAERLAPRSILRGHSQAVTGVAWAGISLVVSASMDGTVRSWDAATAQSSHTVGGLKGVQALALSSDVRGGGGGGGGGGDATGALLAATGHDNGLVQLWDARARPSEAAAARLLSHTRWVSALAFAPASPYRLLSASHDGCLKVWDIRGKLPLHTLGAHGAAKVLCAAWGGKDGRAILSGGADCRLLVHATAHTEQ